METNPLRRIQPYKNIEIELGVTNRVQLHQLSHRKCIRLTVKLTLVKLEVINLTYF